MNFITDVILPLALAFIMFTLGLGLTFSDFARVAKTPKNFIIGLISQLIFLPIVIILSLPLLFQSTPTEILKLKTFDAFVETPEESGNFVILNITDKDVQARGGYPFPRRDLAQIHVDLLNAGATGVGWVILFPEPDRFQGDDAFAEAIDTERIALAPRFDLLEVPSKSIIKESISC